MSVRPTQYTVESKSEGVSSRTINIDASRIYEGDIFLNVVQNTYQEVVVGVHMSPELALQVAQDLINQANAMLGE